MAQQCGPIFLECTWDNLTFYKMEGKYYVRKKSSLTREKVLTHPNFALTMTYAKLLGVASKIASSIYSDLPIDWRQYWMFRSFTGEAQKMMEAGSTPQETYDCLWVTYVEYWVLYQQATGIALKTGRTAKRTKPKTYKTRLKHRTSNEKCRRYRKLIGKNHWKSSYDHTKDILERERRREQYEWKLASVERLLAKEKAAEEARKAEAEEWKRLRQLVDQLLQKPPDKQRTIMSVEKEIAA